MQWMNDLGTTVYIACEPEKYCNVFYLNGKKTAHKKTQPGRIIIFIEQKLRKEYRIMVGKTRGTIQPANGRFLCGHHFTIVLNGNMHITLKTAALSGAAVL
jgi:hypothetical protein